MVSNTSSNLSSGWTGPPLMCFASKKWSTISSLGGVVAFLGVKIGLGASSLGFLGNFSNELIVYMALSS